MADLIGKVFDMNFNEYKKHFFEKDPELLQKYTALEPEYKMIRQTIQAKIEKQIIRREPAARCGMKYNNIHKPESDKTIYK